MTGPPSKTNLVIDESVDSAITAALRLKGFTVSSISEESPSITDNLVLEVAYERNALLITEDKDFGELAVRLKKHHKGILLLRLAGISSSGKAEIVTKAVEEHLSEMLNTFSVLDSNKLRIKSL
jgi:predicted nuclease of predicted toxin-antitoxin system